MAHSAYGAETWDTYCVVGEIEHLGAYNACQNELNILPTQIYGGIFFRPVF